MLVEKKLNKNDSIVADANAISDPPYSPSSSSSSSSSSASSNDADSSSTSENEDIDGDSEGGETTGTLPTCKQPLIWRWSDRASFLPPMPTSALPPNELFEDENLEKEEKTDTAAFAAKTIKDERRLRRQHHSKKLMKREKRNKLKILKQKLLKMKRKKNNINYKHLPAFDNHLPEEGGGVRLQVRGVETGKPFRILATRRWTSKYVDYLPPDIIKQTLLEEYRIRETRRMIIAKGSAAAVAAAPVSDVH